MRIGFDVINADALKIIRDDLCDDRSELPIESDQEFGNEVFEQFAHWYDYKHFYNAQLEPYLLHVWRSWIALPVVNMNIGSYLLRSYVIFALDQEENLKPAYTEGKTAFAKKCAEIWSQHLEKVRELVVLPSISPEDEAEFRESAVKYFLGFYSLRLYDLFSKHDNNDFAKDINADYDNLEKHITDILNGQFVTDEIPNPYLLTKEVISRKLDGKDLRAATALIISLKNRSQFYSDDEQSN